MYSRKRKVSVAETILDQREESGWVCSQILGRAP